MGPESILLSVVEDGGEGIYSFVCPVCTEDVEKQADRKIVALLVSAGVCLASQDQSAAPVGPVERYPVGAPAFTADDVIRFHFLLEDDSYLDRFLLEG